MTVNNDRMMQLFVGQFVFGLSRTAPTLGFFRVAVARRFYVLHSGVPFCFAAFAFLHTAAVTLSYHGFMGELGESPLATTATVLL
jgi:hypothetical protein